MADWDADSSQLRDNIETVLRALRDDARARKTPTVEMARIWQKTVMRGLDLPDPAYAGRFRGEAGLENCQVIIGRRFGVEATRVATELASFERKLQLAVAALDDAIAGDASSASQLAGIIEVCAWAHAEWVRIHPFANGNGRTARLWANFIAMRYGLPPFIAIRPRPGDDYERASAAAMDGERKPTEQLFRRMLREMLRS